MLVARNSMGKLALLTVGAVAMSAAAGFVLTLPDISDRVQLAGYVGVPFFALCALIGARRMFDKGVVLRIDDQGVFDRRVADRVIPWNAIADVSELEIRRQVSFGLVLDAPLDQFVDSKVKRMMAGVNKAFGGDLYLTASGLDVSTDQLRTALRSRLAEPVA